MSALFGLLAEFETPEALREATSGAYKVGYRKMDAFAPFPVEGLAEALGRRKTGIAPIVLTGGIVGGCGAYFMQWYAMAIDYPLNIGGRPLHSWPAFIPITFELTVLCASLCGLVGMILLNGLPRLHHPLFNAPGFSRASIDRFFLCIEAGDSKFDREWTRRFLENQQALCVEEVEI